MNILAFARLDNQGLVDELRQNLFAQFVIADLCAFRDGSARPFDCLRQLAAGNHFVVGDGGNAVAQMYAVRTGFGIGRLNSDGFDGFFYCFGLRGCVCVQCQTECGGKNQGFDVHGVTTSLVLL